MKVGWTACTTMGMLVAVTSSKARADGGSRVVVVHERTRDPAIARAEVRLASELRAAGFDVDERTVESTEDARDVVEEGAAGSEHASFATIYLHRSRTRAATDIWVADHVTNKTTVRRIEAAPSDTGDKILALRVVELMRASLVEPMVLPPPKEAPPPPPPPADVTAWVAPVVISAPPVRDRVEIGAGVGVLYASSSLGAAVGPSISLSIPVVRRVRVRAGILGPAFGSRVSAIEGDATVRQELATVELALDPTAPASMFRPYLAIGGGAYHLAATGVARAPYTDSSADAWAALASAGLGARLRFNSWAGLSLDGRALFAGPRPVVVFAADEVAAAGRPTLALALALDVGL